MDNRAKARQLRACFGIPTPESLLRGSLRDSRFSGVVTELARSVALDRMEELTREVGIVDAAIVLGMRGCPVCVIAAACTKWGHHPDGRSFRVPVADVEETAAAMSDRWARLEPGRRDYLAGVAQRTIRLWEHV